MIEIEFNKRSINRFETRINKIANNLINNAQKGVNKALEETKKEALLNKAGNSDESLINTESNIAKTKVVGRVFTDKDKFNYAPFLEYGTGYKADGTLPHIGKTGTFKISNMRFWYAPADVIKRQANVEGAITFGDLSFPKSAIFNGKKYVLVFSQSPKPFMRPTAFNRRKDNIETIKETIKEGIEEDLK